MSSSKHNSAKKNKPDKQSLGEEKEVKPDGVRNQESGTAQKEPLHAEAQEVVADEEQQQLQPEEVAEDFKEKFEAVNEKHLRLMAEFDNFRKRTSRDYERLIEAANEKLMLELVEVRENFDRALRTTEKNEECKSFHEGMELIYAKFSEILEKNGLEPFAAIGEQFDPQIHDALMKTEHPTLPEDHIAEVFEKGYRLKSRVVKHARVIVSSGVPQNESE